MEGGWIQELLQWVAEHPNWAYGAVFVVAIIESIFLFGLLVPGAVFMFTAGAVIATGAISFWPTIGIAVVGAVIGDGFSYWLGRHYRYRLERMWPMNRFPGLMQRGYRFCDRHGGKSVLLGRFVGAVRPVIPTVVGMGGMPPLRFVFVNVISAIAWAPCYIFPGVVFGYSLSVAAEVATRLVVVLVIVITAVWLLVWLGRNFFLFIGGNAEILTTQLMDWSQRHRRLGLLGPSLSDPTQPETPALAIIALVLLISTWLLFSLLWGSGAGFEPTGLDAFMYHQFQALHTPWTDTVAVALIQLGGWPVYAPIAVAVLAGLILSQRRRAAGHWLVGLAFAAVLVIGLNLILETPDPVSHFSEQPGKEASTGNLLLSIVVYGFLAVLLAPGKSPSMAWTYYGLTIVTITLIALAQLYLGANWFSDIAIAIGTGTLWASLLALGYRRHRPDVVPGAPVLALVLAAALPAIAYQWSSAHEGKLSYYRRAQPVETIDTALWRQAAYGELPAFVVDIGGRRRTPLNLQWAEDLEQLSQRLEALGWRRRSGPDIEGALKWLSEQSPIDQLPIIPRVHDGHAQAAMFSLPAQDAQQLVIRLWPTRLRLEEPSVPVWIGSISRQQTTELLWLLRIPRTTADFNTPVYFLIGALGVEEDDLLPHPQAAEDSEAANWNGNVLLVEPSRQPDS